MYSEQVLTEIDALLAQAAALGTRGVFAASLAAALRQIRTDPLVFGETRHELRHMRVVVRVGVIRPAVVIYAVHTERPLVFLNRVLML